VKKETNMIQEALSVTFASQARSHVSNTKLEPRLNIKWRSHFLKSTTFASSDRRVQCDNCESRVLSLNTKSMSMLL